MRGWRWRGGADPVVEEVKQGSGILCEVIFFLISYLWQIIIYFVRFLD
jgi:hypothetical protein